MHMDLPVLKLKTVNKRPTLSLYSQYQFLQQLHRLLTNGYALLEALTMLMWDKKWSHHAKLISSRLKEGDSFDQSLQEANFHESIVAFMYLSRLNGDMVTAIEQCCLMLRQQMEHLKKFKQTVKYPILLLAFSAVLLYFVKTSVYPSFNQLFVTASESSTITQASIHVIDFIFNSILIIFALSLIIYLGWLGVRSTISTKQKINIYHCIPILRSTKKLNTTFLFSLQMSSLLKAGVSLKESLEILRNQILYPIIAYYSDLIIMELEKGNQVVDILPNCQLFETELTSIFSKSTNYQTLEKDLYVYAEFLIKRLQEKIVKLISLIQPVIFIFLAIMIILVYLSIMLPMFQLIDTL